MTIEAGVPDPEQHPEAGSAGTAREAQALARAGVRLCQQERYAEAVEALRGAAALAPGDALIGNNLAVVLERAGQTEAAIGEQERSLELMLEQPDSWVFLGNLKLKREDWAGAGAAFEAALALRGGDGEPAGPGTAVVGLAWQGLGLVRQKERRLPEAIECFRKCLKLNYVTAPILSILGQLFHETGQFEKARDAYVAALAYDGGNPIYRDMRREMDFVCAALREDGEALNGALALFLRDQAERPGKEEKSAALLLQSTFALLNVHGHMTAARAVAALRVEKFPQSASAAYLLQVVEGTNVPARSPDAYLVEYFDGFAARFEGHLVGTLGYDVPRKLGAALAEFVAAEGRLAVLDAGCGTGLCGPHVRGFAREGDLTGVDLSPKMLAQAEARGLYDRLVCRELTAFLEDSPEQFDVAVAADVLIYFGDLVPLAAGLARAIRPGGWLAISTEGAPDGGHRQQRSGRFAHHPEYVRGVFGADFAVLACAETTIRLEASRPLAGNLFVLRRKEAGIMT